MSKCTSCFILQEKRELEQKPASSNISSLYCLFRNVYTKKYFSRNFLRLICHREPLIPSTFASSSAAQSALLHKKCIKACRIFQQQFPFSIVLDSLLLHDNVFQLQRFSSLEKRGIQISIRTRDVAVTVGLHEWAIWNSNTLEMHSGIMSRFRPVTRRVASTLTCPERYSYVRSLSTGRKTNRFDDGDLNGEEQYRHEHLTRTCTHVLILKPEQTFLYKLARHRCNKPHWSVRTFVDLMGEICLMSLLSI